MVRRAAILAASVLVSLAAADMAAAQRSGAPGPPGRGAGAAGPDFALLNRTARPVAQLYASPAGLGEWGYDRTGTTTVPPGGRHVVRLQDGAGCHQDLRILYRDGARQDLPDLDICVTREVVLGDQAAGPVAGPVAGPGAGAAQGPLLALRNQGRLRSPPPMSPTPVAGNGERTSWPHGLYRPAEPTACGCHQGSVYTT
jgi:hypothetical protein